MPAFTSVKIGFRLIALVAVFLLGFGLFGFYVFRSLEAVKVNGPMYSRIVQSKDLIADVLPPPEHVIESYLGALQMVRAAEAGADTATLGRMAARGAELRRAYEARHAFWAAELPEEPLKRALIEDSYVPAMEFYRVLDEQLVPALLAGDIGRAQRLSGSVLQVQYERHRAAIDQVVEVAKRRAAQDEREAAARLSRTTLLLLLIGLFTAAVTTAHGLLLARSITVPLSTIAAVARGISEGRLDAAPLAGVTSNDEIGVLARTFVAMTEKLKRTLEGLEAKNAEAEQEREKLRQAETNLARIDRVATLGEFTASLAHDIKQPIAAAVTNANACRRWLERTDPDLREARDAAARMVADANRAADIVNRVRSLYRKEAPRRELVDANDVARETIALLRSEAQRNAVTVRADLASDLPRVVADRVQLQQVLMNLMVNAIEAMRSTGGELTVRSECRQDGEALFSISDTGAGVPADKIDAIFGAFFTTKPQGTGMGLSICRSIVESHGGRLWADAGASPGATFRFTLRVAAGS